MPKAIQQAGLRVDPVFHRHHWEVGAVDLRRCRDVRASGRWSRSSEPRLFTPMTKKRSVSTRLARANHVVPPALACLACRHRRRPHGARRSARGRSAPRWTASALSVP
jgi:hypothetical protein